MALFKSSEERRIEREMKIRQGIRGIERAIREQNKFMDDFAGNARQAKAIGDHKQYEFTRNSLKKTMLVRKVLERQLLAVKNALLIKRQAQAGADFTRAMKVMATEIGRLFGETDMARTQADWEKLRYGSLESQVLGLFPSAGNLALTTRILKEYIGILVYTLRGWQ